MVERREGPSRRVGVSLPGGAVAVLVSIATVALGGVVVTLALRGVLPPHFVLALFPLSLCAAALFTSDIWRTPEENLDRYLGRSFRGEKRDAARAAYAELWSEDEA